MDSNWILADSGARNNQTWIQSWDNRRVNTMVVDIELFSSDVNKFSKMKNENIEVEEI